MTRFLACLSVNALAQHSASARVNRAQIWLYQLVPPEQVNFDLRASRLVLRFENVFFPEGDLTNLTRLHASPMSLETWKCVADVRGQVCFAGRVPLARGEMLPDVGKHSGQVSVAGCVPLARGEMLPDVGGVCQMMIVAV